MKRMISSAVVDWPALTTTKAVGSSPSTSCGRPTTPASSTAGWVSRCFSMLVGTTWSTSVRLSYSLNLLWTRYLRGPFGIWWALCSGRWRRGSHRRRNSLCRPCGTSRRSVIWPFPSRKKNRKRSTSERSCDVNETPITSGRFMYSFNRQGVWTQISPIWPTPIFSPVLASITLQWRSMNHSDEIEPEIRPAKENQTDFESQTDFELVERTQFADRSDHVSRDRSFSRQMQQFRRTRIVLADEEHLRHSVSLRGKSNEEEESANYRQVFDFFATARALCWGRAGWAFCRRSCARRWGWWPNRPFGSTWRNSNRSSPIPDADKCRRFAMEKCWSFPAKKTGKINFWNTLRILKNFAKKLYHRNRAMLFFIFVCNVIRVWWNLTILWRVFKKLKMAIKELNKMNKKWFENQIFFEQGSPP